MSPLPGSLPRLYSPRAPSFPARGESAGNRGGSRKRVETEGGPSSSRFQLLPRHLLRLSCTGQNHSLVLTSTAGPAHATFQPHPSPQHPHPQRRVHSCGFRAAGGTTVSSGLLLHWVGGGRWAGEGSRSGLTTRDWVTGKRGVGSGKRHGWVIHTAIAMAVRVTKASVFPRKSRSRARSGCQALRASPPTAREQS